MCLLIASCNAFSSISKILKRLFNAIVLTAEKVKLRVFAFHMLPIETNHKPCSENNKNKSKQS